MKYHGYYSHFADGKVEAQECEKYARRYLAIAWWG